MDVFLLSPCAFVAALVTAKLAQHRGNDICFEIMVLAAEELKCTVRDHVGDCSGGPGKKRSVNARRQIDVSGESRYRHLGRWVAGLLAQEVQPILMERPKGNYVYAPGTDSVCATNTWFPSGSSRLNHFTPEPGPYKSSLISFVLRPFSLSASCEAAMSDVEK